MIIIIKVLMWLGIALMLNGIVMTYFYARRSIKQERLGRDREGRHSFSCGIEWALVTIMGFLLIVGACALLVISIYNT